MHEIEIYDFDGRHVAFSPDGLDSILRRRHEDANSFECSSTDSRFPYLSLFVTGERAALHWFLTEDHAGHQSVGDDRSRHDARFVENKHGSVIWLPGSAVVGSDVAIRCVQEFACDLARPSLVRWTEL